MMRCMFALGSPSAATRQLALSVSLREKRTSFTRSPSAPFHRRERGAGRLLRILVGFVAEIGLAVRRALEPALVVFGERLDHPLVDRIGEKEHVVAAPSNASRCGLCFDGSSAGAVT